MFADISYSLAETEHDRTLHGTACETPKILGPEIILFCDECKRKSRHVTVDGVVSLLGVSRATTYDWMKRGRIHWQQEYPRGYRFICRNSLSHSVVTTKAKSATASGPILKGSTLTLLSAGVPSF
jgi:predicted DNA-binding transcriptional regulator AlpA